MREGDPAAERFLSVLARGREAVDASDICLVVAHPDDETVSCGAQLARLRGVSVVLVTDGAPRDLLDAHAYGFAGAAEYARARAEEFEAAMRLADVGGLVRLDVPDQAAARELTPVAHRLAEHFRACGIRVAITHAFEGGHPDHDATAFAVHAARTLLGKRGYLLDVVEVPLYRLGEQGTVMQCFVPASGTAPIRIALEPAAQEKKQQMLDVYVTQRMTLSRFNVDAEWFRPAPSYAFGTLPNAGRVLYETQAWGLTGSEWCALARRSLRQLGLQGAP